MTTKNKIWRPPKIFKPKPKENILRSRWRPKKNQQKYIQETRLSKIFFLLKNKITSNSIIDNISLWLLVTSMLLFIFSISIKWNKIINPENKEIISEESQNIQEKRSERNIQEVNETTKQNIKNLDPEEKLIYEFYERINQKNFEGLNILTDNALKQSNTYKTYYNKDWLSRFLNNLSEWNITISDIKQVANPQWKSKKIWIST
jgi:hypothetical protein